MICETMIVPLKWQSTQSGEKNGSLRFGPMKPVLYVIIHFSFGIYTAVCFRMREEKCPSQKMANVSVEPWSRGWRVQILQADCLIGIPQGYVTLAGWWKRFSWPLSTPVSSSINRDNNWICHADLEHATVKPHMSEFYKAKKKKRLFFANSACSPQISWGLRSTSHFFKDPGSYSSHCLDYCQSPYRRGKSSGRLSPASALT